MVDMSNISEVVEVVSGISPELAKRAGYLIFILQAAGIILIIYLLYLLINGFFNWRRNRRINKMYYMVKELDAKIELIIGKMRIREQKEYKKEKAEKKEKKRKWYVHKKKK